MTLQIFSASGCGSDLSDGYIHRSAYIFFTSDDVIKKMVRWGRQEEVDAGFFGWGREAYFSHNNNCGISVQKEGEYSDVTQALVFLKSEGYEEFKKPQRILEELNSVGYSIIERS